MMVKAHYDGHYDGHSDGHSPVQNLNLNLNDSVAIVGARMINPLDGFFPL